MFSFLLAVTVWGVHSLHLPLSGLLVSGLSALIALMLIANILPELRQVYQSAKINRLLGGYSRAGHQVLEELVSSLLEFTHLKTGALLVFPGKQDIEDLVTGGERIDAALNRSILLSLFNTHCPRHDGAAVIQAGKINWIGGVLPLAASEQAGRDLGTRHLAALGLSQECDAHILVVSEERATLSLAHKGVLRILPTDPTQLRTELSEMLGIQKKSPSHTLFSLALSGAAWVLALLLACVGSVALERQATAKAELPLELRELSVPIKITGVPSQLYVDGPGSLTCTVSVKAPRETDALSAEPKVELALDLSAYPTGPADIALQSDLVRGLPKDWKVDRIEPAQLKLELKASRTLQIPIKVTTVGLDETRFRLRSKKVSPDKIEAEVRDSTWSSEEALSAQPLDLSGLSAGGTHTFHIPIPIPASIRATSGESSPTVKVELTIQERGKK